VSTGPGRERLDWLDPTKAFALIAVLLNHLVEEFGPGPWFTNPTNSWGDLAARLHMWPSGPLPVAFVRWLGWLGDSGPGVFIFASGVGLAFAAARRPSSEMQPRAFYRRRLLRLYPLYIVAHLVVLTAALVVPGNTLSLSGPSTLLSLLGLRFTRGLFFYIDPSWWFVWTILQLYLAFPLLLLLLERRGTKQFLVLAVALTVVARGAGILFSGSLYFWMMGMFAGTRLAEFAVGMVVGWVVVRQGRDALATAALPRLLAGALGLYVAGLLASFVLPGTLVSNLLVTLGLVGLFGWLWRAVVLRAAVLTRFVMFAGAVSYPVFLLHQPFLIWTKAWAGGNTVLHLAASLGVLVLSFPAGWLMERMVSGMPARLGALAVRRWLALGGGVAVLGALLFLEPLLYTGGTKDRLFSIVLGLSGLAIALLARGAWGAVSCAAAVAAVVQLFVLPERNGDVSAAIGVAVGLAWLAAGRWVRLPALRLAAAAVAVGLIMAVAEASCWVFKPWETNAWGERPALERHPTRVYGLRPNQVTRLRYNNYDYIVRTNRLGLPGPEVVPERATPNTFRVLVIGDAFTMPEGMSYDRAYPALLEGLLARCMAPRPVQVINAGVTGYGPREELPQLRELAPLLRPDVVAYQFFANEFMDIRVSAAERLRNIGLVRTGSRREYVVGRSQLVARLRRLEAAIRERMTGEPAQWRYGRALLELVTARMNPDYTQHNLDSMAVYLTAMRRASEEAGARMVVFFVPVALSVMPLHDLTYFPRGENVADTSRYDLARPWKELAAIAAGHGIDVADPTSALRTHRPQPVYFASSWHWTPEGHQVAASAIAGTLAARGLVPPACGEP
jgi:peptidoglycan/LPS O-acetylase OafA/YrhL